MALLYSNSGKLMRLCAQVFGNSTKSCATEARGQFTQQEETYFNKVSIHFGIWSQGSHSQKKIFLNYLLLLQ